MDSLKSMFKKGPGPDKEVVSILKKIPVFQGLTAGELTSVAAIMHKREFNKGEVIMRQGSAGHGMYIIVDGSVAISEDSAGKALAELHNGDFFGEMALLYKSPRMATATARTHCKVLSFFQTTLTKLASDSPALGSKIISRLTGIAEQRLHMTKEQVAALKKELGGE